ncbi:GNAT family acetyltransferase, partial [bacterium]|nr:GNAT family acetyltransferase [bacterium]
MKSRKGIVRLFEEKDRKLIRAICRQTGQKGNPARLFFEDEEIVPMIFADYYMDYEPESCLVAEVDGRVVGYMLACKDT